MNKSFFFTFTIYIFFFGYCYAQWQPDVRLTNEPANSYTSNNNAWCIASSGDNVHAVWCDERDGNKEIYYKRSIDGGVNWSVDKRLTNNDASSDFPTITISGLDVYVVWREYRDGNSEIYYNHSIDWGISWNVDTRLTNNSAESRPPSVSVSGSIVHVVWYDFRDGNWEIYYKRSTDWGSNWGTDTRLTNNSSDSEEPSISVSGSVVHVVWWDYRDVNEEIYYKRSIDGGINWSVDTRLTNNPSFSASPSVAISGSVVHVVWSEARDGNLEIYYKRSTDGGVSWEADTRLTNNIAGSFSPSLSVSGLAVHVVWRDYRDGNPEIYYKRSTDGGINWELDTRLTSNSAISYDPSVSASGSVAHVIWWDNRDGNNEIYYKRDPTGNLIGIKIVNYEIPKEFSISQNYPNPFNPSTTINFSIPNEEFVKMIVFDNLGREVQTLVNENIQPGNYSVTVNGSNLSSGVYYYKLITDNFTATKKMLMVK